MRPSEWPQWLRDTIPAWAMLVVLVWFTLQRFLDRDRTRRLRPATYGRPTRDPRVICPLIGFVGVSVVQIMFGPVPGSINSHWVMPAQIILAAMMIVGSLFTLVGAYTSSEYRSIGLEVTGCIILTGVFTVYFWAYTGAVVNWAASVSVIYTVSLLAGNLWRVVQLLRRVE